MAQYAVRIVYQEIISMPKWLYTSTHARRSPPYPNGSIQSTHAKRSAPCPNGSIQSTHAKRSAPCPNGSTHRIYNTKRLCLHPQMAQYAVYVHYSYQEITFMPKWLYTQLVCNDTNGSTQCSYNLYTIILIINFINKRSPLWPNGSI